ncbi:MAG: fused MFS/spermidine synthase [Candidatus Gracilibacteria bacterium]
MKKYLLEITVFICGAVIMIFELIGARILGPYLGTSIFVWTSLIGIILGSLSLGYYLGGKIADKKADLEFLSKIVFLGAIFILVTIVIKNILLIFITTTIDDIKIGSIIASVILFLPASIILGMVSPYVAKLKIEKLSNSGTTIGNLYAISTAGSIIGTFLSGFFLIPFFGTNILLIILSITLLLLSIFIYNKKYLISKFILLFIILIIYFGLNEIKEINKQNGFIDTDTAYSRVWIYDIIQKDTKLKTRNLLINNEHSSAMFLDNNELVYEYTKYYNLARHLNPHFKKTLMFGGAGYSFPKSFLLNYPNSKIDVVEIDPKMTELAKKYFNLRDNKNLHIYHEDGRVYLNKTKNKYDVVFGDAFSSHYSIPYQLTTKEAIQKTYNILNKDGVVILNIISAIEGDKGQFLQAEYKTYKSIFPQVYIFPVRNKNDGNEVQNIILVALKSDKKPDFYSSDLTLNSYLDHLRKKEIISDLPILTDDYAPVDYYINKTI